MPIARAGRVALLVVAPVLLALAACATPPGDAAGKAAFEEANDPIEPANRSIFSANQFVDRNALRPVAEAYENHVPDGVRKGIHNVLANLGEPIVGVNDLLQGNPRQAWTTVRRFAVNTTAGGLGVFDVATGWDLPGHRADFGQTLGVWGIGEGPFVELPLLGPSNVRDAAGSAVGFFVNPFGAIGGTAGTVVSVTHSAAGMVDRRSENLATLDKLESTSLDYYATLRSAYRQRREALVEQGRSPDGSGLRINVDVPLSPAPSQ
jgi:phospholipid-binding lipoprotein MlaA